MLDSVLSSPLPEGDVLDSVFLLSLPEGDVLSFIFYPEGHVLDSVLSSISTRGTCVRLGFIFYLYQREMC